MKRASQTVCGTLAALLFLAPSPLTAGAVSQTDGSVDPTYQADVTGTGTINAAFDLADGRTLLVGDFTSFQGVPAGGVVRIKADGSLDQSFLLPIVSGTVSAVTIGPGGGIIIGGNFSAVNGQPATNIAQLQFDGSFDPSFVTGTGFNGPVRALRLISGAALGFRVCVGGSFTTYNGMATGSLVVLTVYGSIDPSFTALVEGSVAGSVGTVSAIDTQSDGSVVIGGGFRRVGGAARNRIARLTSTGALDATFDPGTGANINVTSVVAQAGGSVVLAGFFSSINGVPRAGLARLVNTGAVDPSFDPGTGADANGTANHVVAAPNGNYFVFGTFSSFNGQPRNSIARLNANGAVDGSWTTPFTSLASAPDFTAGISALLAYSDGTALAAGGFRFRSNIGTLRNSVALLDGTGSISPGFDAGLAARGASGPASILTTSAGQSIVGGSFDAVNATAKAYLARLNSDGAVDNTFATVGSGPDGAVSVLLAQPDGSIIVSGDFLTYDGAAHLNLVRITANGVRDPNFNPVLAFDPSFANSSANGPRLALQPTDNRILIAGFFNAIDGTPVPGLARLNTDGTLDSSLNIGTGPDTFPWIMVPQADGSIYIAGNFSTFNGVSKAGFARLTSTGALNTTFDVGTGLDYHSGVEQLLVQPDGLILVAGRFNFINSVARSGIARLTSTGGVDPSFDPGTGFPPNFGVIEDALPPAIGFDGQVPTVVSMLRQGDGRIVVGGSFSNYNGRLAQSIVRLNTDGSFDPSFCVGDGPSARGTPPLDPDHPEFSGIWIDTLALQGDGKLLAGGDFSTFDGAPHSGLVRLATGPTARLVNLSTRGFVSTGGGQMIAGFIIRGDSPKQVLVRAIGPSLPVPGALANPQITLVDKNAQTLASNDDWQQQTDGGAAVQATGMAPTNPNESAFVITLAPGAYTALVTGVGGATGVGLVEVFDLETPNLQRMINVSTRAMVSTGAGVAIAGFQVRQAHRKVLIRGLGPSLPVTGSLANPTLQLFDPNAQPMTANDDWQASADVAAIQATGRAPANARESAIIADLPIGDYTAILSGVGGTSGIGLIEVYEVD